MSLRVFLLTCVLVWPPAAVSPAPCPSSRINTAARRLQWDPRAGIRQPDAVERFKPKQQTHLDFSLWPGLCLHESRLYDRNTASLRRVCLCPPPFPPYSLSDWDLSPFPGCRASFQMFWISVLQDFQPLLCLPPLTPCVHVVLMSVSVCVSFLTTPFASYSIL